MEEQVKAVEMPEVLADSEAETSNATVKDPKLKNNSFEMQGRIFVVAIMAIPILQWLIFWFYVNIQSIALAFQTSLDSSFTWQNFIDVWNSVTSSDGDGLGIALRNTALYFGETLFLILPSCFVVAFFIYKRIFGYKFFRIMFYLPAIISSLVMVSIYTDFIDTAGPLGVFVTALGGDFPEQGLLAQANSLTPTIVIMVYCYWVGFTSNVLLFAGGMARIPIEVLEASKIEGVGPGREIVSIVFPLIWPTVSTQIVLTFTALFSSSGPILMFTQGKYETSTVSYWIFKQVYGDGGLGGSGSYNFVSCAGLCFTLVGLPVILTVRWLLGKVENIEY